MDAFTLTLWLLRVAFVICIYFFFFLLLRALARDLRSTVNSAGRSLGRLIVVESPQGQPTLGASIPLDAITSLGRDVNNSITVDDGFVSAEHARLTFRGRAWYLEDRGSTNGTFVNGQPVQGVVPVGYGDELQLGQVRLRLERTQP
ncbi:MAG: FHA domain-containing protein [Candidatus Limnocylindrales bacterium]|nr:FHA domain-containing protein [Chloroflexota bacterium]